MSYTALYRKFRPTTFEDVKGQDHIVTTLKNQIKAERLGHAYLFCGTRGTGKTTIAKIFAKTVNCEQPVDGNPCGECALCKSIGAGTCMNVIEIDAASNNGVDNIREIVEAVSYSPAEGKVKVYIIDEVHMLSIGAFNALLKTLEEPPSYVIFILATTEAHKIPITILSRCQRYDFKRISIDTITARLQELVQTEEVQVEEKALRYIAKTADGSMRDALSLLDQCIAFHFGEILTYDKVLTVLGAVDTEVFSRLLRCVTEEKVAAAICLLDEMVVQGRELSQFVNDFTWYLRNLLLAKTSENIEDVIDASTENLKNLKEEADQIETTSIFRYIRIFSELTGQIRYASQKRILIEVAVIKLCKPVMEVENESVLERIRLLEKRIEEGITIDSIGERTVRDHGIQETTNAPKARSTAPLPKAIPEEVKQIVARWESIVSKLEAPAKIYLDKAKLTLGGDNKLLMVMQNQTAYDFLVKEDSFNKKHLEHILSNNIGKAIEVNVQYMGEEQDFEDTYVDLSKIIAGIPIEIEEE